MGIHVGGPLDSGLRYAVASLFQSPAGAGSSSGAVCGIFRITMNRRQWLSGLAAALPLSATPRLLRRQAPAPATPLALELKDFQPRSMLKVPATRVPRARMPVIDFHTHLGFRAGKAGVPQGEEVRFLAPASELLQVMDRVNLRTMVNLTGGAGSGLQQSIARYQTEHPGRFLTFCEPRFDRANTQNYPREQADDIEQSHRLGARGLKVLKTLGLYLREQITTGPLVKIDDRRFDPMWEACAATGMPVAIHVSDPEAFFLPTDRFNERFEELNNHPDWSFYGRDFPSCRELLEARNRVFARHPKTRFVALHVGHDAEDLGYVSECLDRHPNMHVEIAARIGELGRQPRAARRFFDRYQDRILFGTDAIPHGVETPQQIFGDALYEIYFRFLETEDEYFDYAPAPTPPQGRWRIYGIGLPDPILRKVYSENAARLLGLT
jgi:predicted TIM-barrel fold metal-dependent hydrolase